VQFKCNSQALLAGHLAVATYLHFQCHIRCHGFSLNQQTIAHNFKSASVTAPALALVTVWAYLARMPRV
jgi:hypothetical protein